MKLYSLLLLFLIVFNVESSLIRQLQMVIDGLLDVSLDGLNSFATFKSQFNKTYDSEEAEDRALMNFMSRRKFIETYKKNHKPSFEMGVWEYSDLSKEEIVSSMTGYIARPKPKSVFEYDYPSNVSNSVNYVEKGWVTKVMNQGRCGGCWAFSALGALEGQIAKKTGKLLKLSEQNLIDCNKNQNYGNWGCRGGDMKTAYEFITNYQRGIVPASSYRYRGQGNYKCVYNKDNSVGSIHDYTEVSTGNETLLMLALANVGPLAIAVDASLESFQNYQSRVYDDPECSDAMNHAVLLVGYGTDPVRGDYWLVKNSWGQSYGENGYIRIARNRGNLCGIANDITYPMI